MTKSSYLEATQKRASREIAIPYNQFHTVVGLAGPNIKEAVNDYFQRGFKKILLWEYDLKVFTQQLLHLPRGICLHYGDILNAPILPNTFYDLDFCWSMKQAGPYVQKFKENFAITVSLRAGAGWDRNKAVQTFLEYRGEILTGIQNTGKFQWIFTSEKGKYLLLGYIDSSHMLTIKKL